MSDWGLGRVENARPGEVGEKPVSVRSQATIRVGGCPLSGKNGRGQGAARLPLLTRCLPVGGRVLKPVPVATD